MGIPKDTVLLIVLALSSCPAVALDQSAALIRDAQKLAKCMKNLDAECSVSMFDVSAMQAQGAPSANQLIVLTEGQFDRLSSAGARYEHFTILKPEPAFAGDGKLYAFVPYEFALEFPSRGTAVQRGFLVGISRDSGSSWRFIEGSRLTAENIKAFIPSYQGQELPPVFTKHQDTGDEP
jgi:hypothetical protein